MKRGVTLGAALVLLLGATLSTAWGGGVQYAKSTVTVTRDPSPLSAKVATVEAGAAVEVLKQDERNVQVKLPNGATGWANRFKFGSEKPAGASGGGDLLGALGGGGSVYAKESRSGGSIRGLREVSEDYARNQRLAGDPMASVERMERLQVNPDELLRFQEEGRVGEFAGGAK
ncbi:MAG: hypothetical protein HQL56_03730 [Magnetococcales bacterium]|nr:hypothetical protein [Magnetococcales bacterium]